MRKKKETSESTKKPDITAFLERSASMCSDINVYKNSLFAGFYGMNTVLEYFNEYHKKALTAAENASWDYVVLYAVAQYNKFKKYCNMISVNFMTIELPYSLYVQYAKKMIKIKKTRLFFVRGRKEICYL